MLAHITITLASAAVCVLIAGLCAHVSKTASRRHYAIFAALAGCAAVYSAVGAIPAYDHASVLAVRFAGHLNFALSFVIALLWLLFDSRQHTTKLTSFDRNLIVLLICGAVVACIPGLALGEVGVIATYWDSLVYRLPMPNLLALVLMVLILTAFGRVWLRHWGLVRAGGRGARLRLLGYSLWCITAAIEALVAAQALRLPFVGALGFNAGFVAFAADLSLIVTRDAEELRLLNDELSDRVIEGTEELIVTREALVASESQTALGRLAGSLGHEINNPLSYISGNLSFVRDTLSGDPQREEEMVALTDAEDGAARIKKIVEDLAAYVQGSQQSGAKCQVQDALTIAVRIVGPKTKFSMSIESKLGSLPDVAIEERLLVQVLVNLLMNASQASEARSGNDLPVTNVRGRGIPDAVVVEISDKGCGMSSRVRERAFTPLFSASSERNRVGLGLFICRNIMDSVNGTVEITSQIDVGTTIYLSLPVAQGGS